MHLLQQLAPYYSVLPGTDIHLRDVKHIGVLSALVKSKTLKHRDVSVFEGEKHDISLKSIPSGD